MFFFISLTLIVLSIAALHVIDFSASQETIREAFVQTPYTPVYKNINIYSRNIHYVSIGDTSNPAILFVHGSPGSWDNFLAIMANAELLNHFYLLALDRPGYGQSGEGVPERSLKAQANIAVGVLQHEKKSAILVGHSYGAPVVVQMAVDFPESTNGLFLLAGSVHPTLEKTKWFQIPVHYPVLSWILPPPIYSSNEEILALKQELEKLTPYWKTISVPVTIIHGSSDRLVPKENALYAAQMLDSSLVDLVMLANANHFIPWKNADVVVDNLLEVGQSK